jgi:hypothetical protein
MTAKPEPLSDWMTYEEAIALTMKEYGYTREEAEELLEEFDAACPWAVDRTPLQ